MLEEFESDISHMDSNIILYLAGFIARSLKKNLKCEECSNILCSGEDSTVPMEKDIPDNCDCFFGFN